MPISYFDADPIVQNNIHLVQYSKKLHEILNHIEQSYKASTYDMSVFLY